MSNMHEKARAIAIPSDSSTYERYTALNFDVICNARHPLHQAVLRERQALLHKENPDHALPVVGGVVGGGI